MKKRKIHNMTDNQEKKPATAIEWLLGRIEQYLAANPSTSAESFGWFSTRDSSLVERLRGGGDVTTRKLDKIISYLANPQKGDN